MTTWTQISIPPLQVRGAPSDCVHEQVAKRGPVSRAAGMDCECPLCSLLATVNLDKHSIRRADTGMDCRYPFLIELSKSPASIAQSNKQWVGFKKKKASREIPQSLFYATGRTRTGTVLPAWFWVKCVCQFRHSGICVCTRDIIPYFGNRCKKFLQKHMENALDSVEEAKAEMKECHVDEKKVCPVKRFV